MSLADHKDGKRAGHHRVGIALSALGGARWRGLVWCADAALVHSRFTRGELLDATGFPPERVATLGCVVESARFSQE